MELTKREGVCEVTVPWCEGEVCPYSASTGAMLWVDDGKGNSTVKVIPMVGLSGEWWKAILGKRVQIDLTVRVMGD